MVYVTVYQYWEVQILRVVDHQRYKLS